MVIPLHLTTAISSCLLFTITYQINYPVLVYLILYYTVSKNVRFAVLWDRNLTKPKVP